jgi:hypothetical protein
MHQGRLVKPGPMWVTEGARAALVELYHVGAETQAAGHGEAPPNWRN